MDKEQVEPFPDNWAYLKVELNWLDRVLMLAVGRQRKETKEVERIAQSRADRVTSHWWKGILAVEDQDSTHCKTPPEDAGSSKLGYQKQLAIRIHASHQQGVVLGIPTLCDRLQLSLFERHLLLMVLAPEVNRRYGRIYGYLQENESVKLPTVDLVLRILCRNDPEWRAARTRLAKTSPLVQHGLLEFISTPEEPFLAHRLKLSEAVVNYLLAESPRPEDLSVLLQPKPESVAPPLPDVRCSLLSHWQSTIDWADLVLPEALLADLQHLCDRVKLRSQVDEVWGFGQSASLTPPQPGLLALLTGLVGTGKTTAVAAIAHALNTPLFWVDLALIPPIEYGQLLQDIIEQAPTVLLIKSAQMWLGRSAALPPAQVHQFWRQRQQHLGITLLSVQTRQSVKLTWQRQVDRILDFPLPDASDRLRLWQQAFPPQTPLDPGLDWQFLASQWPLSGGDIMAIAREAAFYAAATPETHLQMQHLIQAWQRKSKKVGISPRSIPRSTKPI